MIEFLFVCLILWIFRTRGDEIPPEAIVDRSLSPEVATELQKIPWWWSFRFWSLVLIAVVAALGVRLF